MASPLSRSHTPTRPGLEAAAAPAPASPSVTTAILAGECPSSVRTAVDTLADARDEARQARTKSLDLRRSAADALKAADEADAIAAQAEAEISAALEILARAHRLAEQRPRSVNSPAPAPALAASLDRNAPVVVYTDGACIENRHSAIGVFFGPKHPLNAGVFLRANRHDTGLCEIAAIQCALRLLYNNPDMRGRPIVIRTNYKNILDSSRHERDAVFRAEYNRLRNLVAQFPRGVRYEHVETLRGTFGDNQAHVLARDALRESVRVADPRTNRTSDANSSVSKRSVVHSEKSKNLQTAVSKASKQASKTASTSSGRGGAGPTPYRARTPNSAHSRTTSTLATTAASFRTLNSTKSGASSHKTESRAAWPQSAMHAAAPAASKSHRSSSQSSAPRSAALKSSLRTAAPHTDRQRDHSASRSVSRQSASSRRQAPLHPQSSVRVANKSSARPASKSSSLGSGNVKTARLLGQESPILRPSTAAVAPTSMKSGRQSAKRSVKEMKKSFKESKKSLKELRKSNRSASSQSQAKLIKTSMKELKKSLKELKKSIKSSSKSQKEAAKSQRQATKSQKEATKAQKEATKVQLEATKQSDTEKSVKSKKSAARSAASRRQQSAASKKSARSAARSPAAALHYGSKRNSKASKKSGSSVIRPATVTPAASAPQSPRMTTAKSPSGSASGSAHYA